MQALSSSIPLEKLISKQVRLWSVRERIRRMSQQPTEDPWDAAYVTISRTAGSKGSQVALEVARKLGWQVYGREIVDYIARTAKVRSSVVESFDEKRRSEIQSWIQTAIDRHALGHDRYLHHLLQVLLTIAEHGRAVIIGRGAHLVLPPERGVRVLITAPLETRVNNLVEEHGLSRSEARKQVEQRDSERERWLRHFFKAEANDPTCFDLVLNTGTWRVEEAAEIVIRALEVRLGKPRPQVAVPQTEEVDLTPTVQD